jgi:hypothetical protein
MDSSFTQPNMLLKVLLFCGIIGSLLYAGTDILAGLLKPGYRFDSQSASDLSAFGSTTRPFVLLLNIIAGVLFIAFSIGIWLSADQNWLLRVTACLIAGNVLLTFAAVTFYPIHLDQGFNTFPNKLNVILMMIGLLLLVLAICFGAAANQNWFRYFSIGLILLFILAYLIGTRGSTPALFGDPGPSVGIQERSMFYLMLLWQALLAIVLLKR